MASIPGRSGFIVVFAIDTIVLIADRDAAWNSWSGSELAVIGVMMTRSGLRHYYMLKTKLRAGRSPPGGIPLAPVNLL